MGSECARGRLDPLPRVGGMTHDTRELVFVLGISLGGRTVQQRRDAVTLVMARADMFPCDVQRENLPETARQKPAAK